MIHKLIPAPSVGAKPPQLCVYTTLIGRYEHLNEQPLAAQSSIPFICLTDDPDLESESWEIRQVSPVFGMDPIRSQRDLKLRPHLCLSDFDASLYVDNSVLLTQPPECLFEGYFPASGFCLPEHSFRDSTLDEFLEVARLGFDDQSRIFEQLNHYMIDCPEVLKEKPYWTAIMLRDHRNPRVRAMLEIWAAHVHRYSRRDQLSVNVAFRHAGLTPDVMRIDNYVSWFHSWPHSEGRDREKGMRRPGTSLMPPVAHIRQLEQALAEQAREYEQALAEQAREYEQALAEHTREYEQALAEHTREHEALLASPSWRIATILTKYAHRHPHLARFVWRGLKLCWWTATLQLHRRLPELFRGRQLRVAALDLPPTPTQDPANSVRTKGTIYVDPADERGRQLVLHSGDLNPPSLRMWKLLIAAESWTHIIDVGANYGEMLVNVELTPAAKVIAVEPNPRVVPYLERTLTEAGIRAEIVRCAVAEHVGNEQFLIDHHWSGTSRIAGPEDLAPGGALEPLTLSTTTLAKLLGGANAEPNIRALVKIDVEGQEVNILRGVMEMLDNVEIFEALAEIVHLTSNDLEWIFERFEVQIYDLEADRLMSVVPGTPDHLATLLADSRFYGQDAVLRPKRKPGQSSGGGQFDC